MLSVRPEPGHRLCTPRPAHPAPRPGPGPAPAMEARRARGRQAKARLDYARLADAGSGATPPLACLACTTGYPPAWPQFTAAGHMLPVVVDMLPSY